MLFGARRNRNRKVPRFARQSMPGSLGTTAMVNAVQPARVIATRERVALEVRAALALIGFTAVIAQVVLLRELMVVAEGNEISLGLMLASWLLWTAFGSGVLGRVQPATPRRLVATLEMTAAVALPTTVYAVRITRPLLKVLPGEVLGPGAVLLIALAVLSLLCAVSGWLFAAGARLYAEQSHSSTAEAGGAMYLLEAIGAGAGGIVAGLALAAHLNSFSIAMMLALLNAAAAIFVALRRRTTQITALLLLAAAAYPMFAVAARLDASSTARLWPGFSVLVRRDSVYGNLAVVQTGEVRSVYENGLVLFSVPDPAAAEEAVHYALLQHPAPQHVLLIGGGLNGSVREALKHPMLRRIDYVELDPMLVRLAQQYLPEEWAAATADGRLSVHHGDGRLFVKETPNKYDAIIINLPEPQTAQLNRFYTREFFSEARQALASGGLVALQLRGAENYISPERGVFLRCIFRTLHEVFPEVGVIPGETVHFFAGEQGRATPDAKQLLARLRQRGVETSYVREYFLPFRMMPDRKAEIEQVLRSHAATPVNRDFAPIAYYFDVTLWSTQFNQAYRVAFSAIAGVKFSHVLLTLLACGAILFAMVVRRAKRRRATAAMCVTGSGFTVMAAEVMLLFGVQAIYGYVYYHLALVVAAFMAGMGAGSWIALRRRNREELTLLIMQGFMLVIPPALYLTMHAAAEGTTARLVFAYVLVPVAGLLIGGCAGWQFPVASRMWAYATAGPSLHPNNGRSLGMTNTSPETTPGSAGSLYALDLVGACAGAVVISAWLLPVFGFAPAAAVIAAANAAPVCLAWVAAGRRR